MDPISLAGLVASILTIISKTTNIIEHLSAAKNAPNESKGLLHEVLSLVVILDTLRSRMRDTDPSAP